MEKGARRRGEHVHAQHVASQCESTDGGRQLDGNGAQHSLRAIDPIESIDCQQHESTREGAFLRRLA